MHRPAQACRPGTPFPVAAPPAPRASASPRPARSPRPRATSGPRRRRTTGPRGRRPSRRWWRSRRRPGRESNRPRVRGASRATPTTPPAQAALDERWIAAPTFLDEAFPEGSADGAKLAGAVAELRLDLGPAHVAALAAAGLGDRAAFAAALRAAAAAHDAARADELKAAATTAISAAITQFSVATTASSPADDGEETVHPHTRAGRAATRRGLRRCATHRDSQVQRLPRRRRAQPHEAGDEKIRRGERRRRLALPHRHDALDGRGPRERLRPRGAAQDVQRPARRRPGDRCASPRRRRRRRVRAQAA